MAIQKTEVVNSYGIKFDEGQDAVLIVSMTTSWDDPDDNDLPMSKTTTREIKKNSQTTTYDEDTGTPIHSQTPTDVSGESQMIQDICAIIWA